MTTLTTPSLIPFVNNSDLTMTIWIYSSFQELLPQIYAQWNSKPLLTLNKNTAPLTVSQRSSLGEVPQDYRMQGGALYSSGLLFLLLLVSQKG